MALLKSDVEIVKKYWFSISKQSHEIFIEFYEELFKRFPGYRQYFHKDMDAQVEKFARMINLVINGAEVWDKIQPEIEKLGRLHAAIADFEPKDYQNIVNTLLDVMQRHKGYEDAEAYQAWQNLFSSVSKIMMKASESVDNQV